MRFDRHDLIYRLRHTLFFSLFFVRRRCRRRRSSFVGDVVIVRRRRTRRRRTSHIILLCHCIILCYATSFEIFRCLFRFFVFSGLNDP